MIIHLDGTAQELLEFVKGMQFPTTEGFCEAAEEMEEAAKETQAEVEKEVERLFDAAKAVTGENTKLGTIPVELHWLDLADLRAEANKRGTTGCELAAQIINDWLDKQRKARV